MSPPRESRLPALLLLLTLSSLGGCKPKSETDADAPTASATATAARPEVPKPPVYNIPVGPAFAIEPGIGIGPIRFGATVATIERHMTVPCTEKSETLCRYAIHAVDFHLTDGVLSKIHIQSNERPFKHDGSGYNYGIFNGRLLNGVEIGMYREYVEKTLGVPTKGTDRDPVAEKSPFPTVFVGEYPGMTLEYDKIKNGNVVLAGIVLTKAPTTPGTADTATAPTASAGPTPAAAPKPTAKPRPKPPLH